MNEISTAGLGAAFEAHMRTEVKNLEQLSIDAPSAEVRSTLGNIIGFT